MVYKSLTKIDDKGIEIKTSFPHTKFKQITDVCLKLDDAINEWLEGNPNVRVVSYSNICEYYGDLNVLIEYIEVDDNA